MSGRIHTKSVTGSHAAVIAEAMASYPELEIIYDEVKNYTVRFYNGDVLIATVTEVTHGSSANYPGSTPVKQGVDVPDDWAFVGWSPDPTNVIEDMDCYAQFVYVGQYTRKLVQRTISGAYVNDRVTVVGESAFQGADSLGSISMAAVTSVEKNAFKSCVNLVSAYLPSAVSIKEGSFNTCYLLERVDLPVATYIGMTSFYNDSALETLILRTTEKVCELYNTGVFYNTPISKGTGYIYVPATMVDLYKVATNWSNFAERFRTIEDWPGICGGV